MKTVRQTVGRTGEDEACRYLEALGHMVVERNWRSGHLEVDIITLAHDGMHFVEVKTRTAPVAADPEVNVNFAKRRHIADAAKAYIHSMDASFRMQDIEIFFDVLTVVLDGGKAEIRYYPQAYIPMYV